ncbi:MAG TPA: hypothetical protein PLF96_05635 [Thermotogota bacterium]|nr:hypothetical protein [Thermotogota bacterium]
MPDQNQDLEKLLKLKEAIKKDVEKKTGKKLDEGNTRESKLRLSDEVKKRISSQVSLPLSVEEVRTFLDVEMVAGEANDEQLMRHMMRNLEKVTSLGMRNNILGMIKVYQKKYTEALQIFADLALSSPSEAIRFDGLLARMVAGEDVEQDILAFLKQSPRSFYPYLLLLFRALFEFSSFQAVPKVLEFMGRITEHEMYRIIDAMQKLDFPEVIRFSNLLYRKNRFKEFQNIARLLPFAFEKDSSMEQYTLDTLEKKKNHFCSQVYFELFTGAQVVETNKLNSCPMSTLLLVKRCLRNNAMEEAVPAVRQLQKWHDPYGDILTGSIAIQAGQKERGYAIWHSVLLPFENVLFGWMKGRSPNFKGLGLLRMDSSLSWEKLAIPESFEQFSAMLDSRFARFEDAFILLYPYEEFRAFFGGRLCTRFYASRSGE